MSTFETLNELLVRLFRDVMEIEQRALINQDFKDITNNDLHVIEAIGIGEAKNMSAIAKELSVTMGTLTIAMNSLVKKGYVVRNRCGGGHAVPALLLCHFKGRYALFQLVPCYHCRISSNAARRSARSFWSVRRTA